MATSIQEHWSDVLRVALEARDFISRDEAVRIAGKRTSGQERRRVEQFLSEEGWWRGPGNLWYRDEDKAQEVVTVQTTQCNPQIRVVTVAWLESVRDELNRLLDAQ